MGRVFLALVLVIGCACSVTINTGTASPAATVTPSRNTATATPSARPAPSTVLAVLTGPANIVRLASSDGTIVATTSYDRVAFRPHSYMSWTSATLTRLYYLNGGSDVHYLLPTGVTGSATRISVGAGEEAGFAVSPDDMRIAVAIFSYALPASTQGSTPPTYKGMRMYVEDLNGGGHHVDIFTSTTVAEFPIGWTAGHLVIAITTPLCCQALPLNPYAATSYHVASPDNGDRLTSLCENSYGPSGPVEPVGTMCLANTDGPMFQHWDGSPFPPPSAVQVSYQYLNALSPDGLQAATGGNPIRILTHNDDRLPESGTVYGWLDASHLVFQREKASTLSVFDLSTRSSTDLPGGEYLGTFPAAIS